MLVAESAEQAGVNKLQVVGVGTDIVRVARVERLFKQYGERFLKKVFTPREQAYCLDKAFPAQHLAGRFAAKEAVAKACYQAGWEHTLGWTQIQIYNDSLGRPRVSLPDSLPYRVLLSISHEKENAVAVALALTAS